jgi:hypothetical protein
MAIQIKVNDVVVHTIDDTHVNILKSYINEDVLLDHIGYCVDGMMHCKCDEMVAKFRDEWISKLQADPEVTSAPISTDAFVEMIIDRPDYQTEKQKEQSL